MSDTSERTHTLSPDCWCRPEVLNFDADAPKKSESPMTEEELQNIAERACASSPEELVVMSAGDHTTGEIYDDHERISEWLAENIRKGSGPLYGVCIDEPGLEEECRTVAITGNGPTSEANALFIVRARADVLRLVAEVHRMSGELDG